jgi:hypothetical protein
LFLVLGQSGIALLKGAGPPFLGEKLVMQALGFGDAGTLAFQEGLKAVAELAAFFIREPLGGGLGSDSGIEAIAGFV